MELSYRSMSICFLAAATLQCAGAQEEVCLEDCGGFDQPQLYFVEDDATLKERKAAFEQSAPRSYGPEVFMGVNARPGDYNAVVALSETNGGGVHCTGNLISDRFVITARHCCKANNCATKFAHFGRDITTPTESIAIENDIRFPVSMFDSVPDIVLLQLARKPSNASPIPIAPSDWIDNALAIRVAGFGRTEYETSGIKNIGDSYIASNDCNRKFDNALNDEDLYGCIPDLELVGGARTDYPADTCKGDSGGAAFVVPPEAAQTYDDFDAAFDKKNYAIGAITSRVIKRSRKYIRQNPGEEIAECGVGGVYLRLDGPIYNWLETVAAEQGEVLPALRH